MNDFRDLDAQLKKMNILIVEDDEDTALLIKTKFNIEGIKKIGIAGDGEETFTLLKEASRARTPFDLILLDLMLPDIDGFDLAARIKEDFGTTIIVVTARTSKEDQLKAFSVGADDFIIKPFDPDILYMKVEKALTKLCFTNEIRESNRRNQRLFLNILQVMAKVLEAKDPYTKFHSEKVAKYARSIAKRLGFDDEALELIQIAGILHDFGKIGVKEGILNKPGHLDEEEFEAVKKHPLIASTILEPIEELKTVIDDIKYHHEYYNGMGYPSGLKGEDIPIGARILMVADSYDAMISERSYHKAMTKEESIKELSRCAGTQFDPNIAEIFIEILKDEDSDKKDKRRRVTRKR